jgi:alkanesulfonate monooxygenase SsuD/methylene tetrahydromethanopterin reductase-like flavin-dependent oxidoreductase (luciferase family)
MAESDGTDGMPSWPEILGVATSAERLGLDSVWVCDHFFQSLPGEPRRGIHEGWTIVSALAAATSKIEVGQLVMCTAYRNPGLLAKMAATADAVSGGRLTLGLGAGWDDSDYQAFGYPTDHRVGRFEEALRIIAPLVRGEGVTSSGAYHRIDDGVLLPPPERRIPILIGGNGPRILRLTARHADGWNTAWYGYPDDRLAERLSEMERALVAEGRDPGTLRRTVGVVARDPDADADDGETAIAGSVEELARALTSYEALGVDDVIVLLLATTSEALERLAAAFARVPFDAGGSTAPPTGAATC